MKRQLFIFKKGVQEIHLCGTCYNVDASALPEPMKNFIVRHNKLVIENKDFRKPISEAEMRDLGFVLGDGEASILDSGDLASCKAEVVSVITRYLAFKDCSFPVDKLNAKGLYNLFQMASYFVSGGMDCYFAQAFYDKGADSVSGLEARGDLRRYISEDEAIDVKGLVDIHLGTYARSYQKVRNLLYLHNLNFPGMESTEDTTGEIRDRNLAWLEEIQTKSADDIICVGQDHLHGKHGLLKLLSDEGYSIRQMVDDAGAISWKEVDGDTLTAPAIVTISDVIALARANSNGDEELTRHLDTWSDALREEEADTVQRQVAPLQVAELVAALLGHIALLMIMIQAQK